MHFHCEGAGKSFACFCKKQLHFPMSKQLTVSSTSKHRLQIIDAATDFTEKHPIAASHQPATSHPPKRQERRCGTFCCFQPRNRDKTSCLHPSSLASRSLRVPGVMAVGGGLQVPLLLNAGWLPAPLSHIQCLFLPSPPTAPRILCIKFLKHKSPAECG